jgi:signal transduction histidine kinase
MSDIFISYSRKDSDFVRQLYDALHAKKQDVWIDWQNIPLSANWWAEICEGIETTNTFVFVMTPDSVASPICNFEIAHAVQHNKRIVPIVRQKVDEKHAFVTLLTHEIDGYTREILGKRDLETLAKQCWNALARHNWLSFEPDTVFEIALNQLLITLNTNLEHIKNHTYLTIRALSWDKGGRDANDVIRGDELSRMETWLANSEQVEPKPSELHIQFILSSVQERQVEERKKNAQQAHELAHLQRQQQLIQLQVDSRADLARQFHNDYMGLAASFIMMIPLVEKVWTHHSPEKALEVLEEVRDKGSQVVDGIRALIWRLSPMTINSLLDSANVQKTLDAIIQNMGRYYEQPIELALNIADEVPFNQTTNVILLEVMQQLFSCYFYRKSHRSIEAEGDVTPQEATPKTVLVEMNFSPTTIFLCLTTKSPPYKSPESDELLQKWLSICDGTLVFSHVLEKGYQTQLTISYGDV